jgi:hypothetical protein
VSWLTTVTLAAGITAPVVSRTVPVIWALVDCALALSAMLNSRANTIESNAAFFNVESPFGIALLKDMLPSSAVFFLDLKSIQEIGTTFSRSNPPFALSS